jgi:glycerophosphoryl diester phosphodiesterase
LHRARAGSSAPRPFAQARPRRIDSNKDASPMAPYRRRYEDEHMVVRRAVLNIAHRGASGRFPENTLSAFRGAIEDGAQMCELDVQLTRDRAVVVIHDKTVDRTTDGSGAVADLSLAEIRRLDAGAKFQGAAIPGERIPTLDEVFAATAGRCGLNIELKAAGAERKVAELMRARGAAGDSMVSSFNWHMLSALRRIDPEIRLGVLAEKYPDRMLDEAGRLRAYAVNPRFDLATRELCDAAHARGFKVLAWTVDVPEAMRLLIDVGVDGIMSNHPARLREVLAA